jgi:hypothetical protein
VAARISRRPAAGRRRFTAPGTPDQVLEVEHAEHVVDALPDHRDPGETGAEEERERLTEGLVGLYPHHLGTRHHHLAGDGVTEGEDRVDHLPLAVLHDAALLGQVDQLAQLHLGGERALPEAAPGGHRVADQDQQRGQRVERPAQPADQRRDRPADRDACCRPMVRGATPTTKLTTVIAPAVSRAAASQPEAVHRDQRHQGGRGQLGEQSEQEQQVEVTDHVTGDGLEGTRAAYPVPGQFGGPGGRYGGERGLGRRDHPGEHHQAGREDQQLQVGQAGGGAGGRQWDGHHRDRVDRQLASSRAWSVNISRSSSGSAWS